ncbi:MAG: aspartyl/asparaginyl beta-hydroxylase domain-containing protein [Gammaproteobacteria bacterium]|nr:aspartyl/asparaginyl beta-hydroxylase domain-containing protein [Gammaproteobacteria bacterium]
MIEYILKPGYIILSIFVLSGMYIHFRGKVRYPLARQLTSHTNLTAPYNTFVYLFSAVPNTPILDVERFPELRVLRDNWETIRNEARTLYEQGDIKAADKYNDAGFNSFFRTGWTRFYLKWYDDFLPSARQLCPKTVELLRSTPSVNAAMFASLPPGANLPTHRDPYAGSLRYHLGLITPNSERCRIYIDGTPHYWKDGEDIIFDETYVHSAVNGTNDPRIILFCDIQRPLRSRVADTINRFVSNHLIKASATQNTPFEKVGVLNRLFGYIYHIRIVGKRLKRWNRNFYYAVKYSLLGGLVYLIFL